MHIIKITPHSFKIILSKDDLRRYGVENVLENKELTGDFFAEIIEETNFLYGNPFTHGTIDAEFFEDKNGGGELFICRTKRNEKLTLYLFCTDSIENIISLSKRFQKNGTPTHSSLYIENGTYYFILSFTSENKLSEAIISEYGKCEKISKFKLWQIHEHASEICGENAVIKLASEF